MRIERLAVLGSTSRDRIRRAHKAAGTLAFALALAAMPAHGEPADDPHLEDPSIAENAPPIPRKAKEAPTASGDAAVVRVRAGRLRAREAGGALSGKTVYLSPGHGLTWLEDRAVWRPQRGNTHGVVEDLISVETVAQELVPMLRNMGAYVVPVRETDLNPNLAIVDDASTGFELIGQPQWTAVPGGYGHTSYPIAGDHQPFAEGASVELIAASQETGRARWTFDVPADGDYNVYVAYTQDPSRAADAHYVVHHAGGQAHFRIDQRRHGGTWVLLGRFRFEAGTSPAFGAVELVDDSATPGATLSADAARIGGGVGLVDPGGGATGRPSFESSARYHAQLAGAPPAVYRYLSEDRSSDVGARPRFAAWDHAPGEDAVYVAWHTNAPEGGRGTSAFAYGPSRSGSLEEFTGVPGSLELMDAVYRELIDDIQAVWDPGWRDRGQFTAYFGEVNPKHNPAMPAALFEIAFHATAVEANALRDPRFRRIAARAIAQGIARYFSSRDDTALVLPPEPPTRVRMHHEGRQLRVAWDPPDDDPAGGDAATGYRVQLSYDGLAFDDGVEVDGTSLMLEVPAGEAVYARVTAINAGGESLPTRVVGVRRSWRGRAAVLVVAGFDRLDAAMLPAEDLSAFALGMIDRGLLAHINDGSHVARYGAALSAAGASFDTASAAAIASGAVSLDGYRAVIWQLGEESSCCDPLSLPEREAISRYLGDGGQLLVTGSELGWALDYLGGDADRAFFRDTFHAVHVADDADTYAVGGALWPFDELPPITFDDDGAGAYDADWPDVLAPIDGAQTVLAYAGGLGGAAGTWYRDDATGHQVVLLGFPFETVRGAAARIDLMARILDGFGITAEEPPSSRPPDGPAVSGTSHDGDEDEVRGGCTASGGAGGALLVLALLGGVVRRRRVA